MTGGNTADKPLCSNDWWTVFPRFAPVAVAAHLGLVQAVQQIAARLGATPGQIALARRARTSSPIPGTGRLERIEENLRAADIQRRTEDLAELDRVSPKNQVRETTTPSRCSA